MHRGDRCVHAPDFGLVLEPGAVNLGDGLQDARFVHLQLNLPLLDLLLGPSLGARQVLRDQQLILGEVHSASALRQGLRRDLHVGLEHLDVLFCAGELGFELFHLVFAGPAVELDQRLALLHRNIRLNEDSRHQRRFSQARDQLDGVLDDFGVVGGGRHEAQSNQEDQEDMHHEEGADQRPGDAEFEPPELEKDQPEEDQETEQHSESEYHNRSL